MRISHSFSDNGHAIQLDVIHQSRGWEVRHQEDGETTRDVVYNDWHRVERAISAFDLKAAALRQHVLEETTLA